jgi:hypothetical protein
MRAPEAPETGASFELPKPAAERQAEAAPAPAPAAAPAPAPATSVRVVGKDPIVSEVEHVLEEGLGDTYVGLPPAVRRKFKQEGERVSAEIAGMVRDLKAKAGKVLKLIMGWLKIIPGVNKFFLFQEAKIKTDRILKMVEDRKNAPPTA